MRCLSTRLQIQSLKSNSAAVNRTERSLRCRWLKKIRLFLALNRNKGQEKGQEISPRGKLVLSLIQENPSISRREIAERLNLTDKQIRTTIENLKNRYIIYHEGPNKGGKWVISTEEK